ncbi:hypothetical protein BD410DRAFT_341136 [Rickenella mellea]|uniref:Uncharacterized protein n=1 Tax=Rickenella mellea TaxID=50990 RepID=A0A4Y7QMG4_9AGAM|nr:hypothetical protein BD410DRAFT_341136 [Rickenella mellea]
MNKGQRIAQVHTSSSNRKGKESLEHKPALKSVLANPFHVKWPSPNLNLQNAILARTIDILRGVSEYHIARQIVSRKGKTRRRSERKRKRGEQPDVQNQSAVQPQDAMLGDGTPESVHAEVHGLDNTTASTDTRPVSSIPIPPPPILSHITVGINEVTKRLEAQYRIRRHVLSTSPILPQPHISEALPNIAVVLVCLADIEPQVLVAHIPQLVAACNANVSTCSPCVKLVPLAKNAEMVLADAMGLRRVAIAALDAAVSVDPALSALLQSVSSVVAPWLTSTTGPSTNQERQSISSAMPTYTPKTLISSHVKQLRTTTPKDMRAAKEIRVKGRSEAKRKKKLSAAAEAALRENKRDGLVNIQ